MVASSFGLFGRDELEGRGSRCPVVSTTGAGPAVFMVDATVCLARTRPVSVRLGSAFSNAARRDGPTRRELIVARLGFSPERRARNLRRDTRLLIMLAAAVEKRVYAPSNYEYSARLANSGRVRRPAAVAAFCHQPPPSALALLSRRCFASPPPPHYPPPGSHTSRRTI